MRATVVFIVSNCYLGSYGTIVLFHAAFFCGTQSGDGSSGGFIHGINAGKNASAVFTIHYTGLVLIVVRKYRKVDWNIVNLGGNTDGKKRDRV